jgi:hypothetical protein
MTSAYQPTTIEYLGDDRSAGTSLGQDADSLISFHGATPIAQATITKDAGVDAAGNAANIALIYAALENKGIIVTA